MKRFYFKLLMFALIVAAMDLGYGIFFDHYRRSTQSGLTHTDHMAAEVTEAPVIIFGSSRAWRHYDSRIITDSLGAGAYNCGYNSMGIDFFLPRLRQMLNRYTPQLIIYDITPLYDLMVSESWPVTLSNLKPHFFDPAVYSNVRERDYAEWIKCHSAFYRLNKKLKKVYSDRNSTQELHMGYAPLNGNKNTKGRPSIKITKHKAMTPDPAKLAMVEEFINICESRNISLVFVLSPYYKNDMGEQTKVLRPIADRHGIQVIDHFNDSTFTQDSTLYWDQPHLNSKGAAMFTRTVVSELGCKDRIRKRNKR